MATTLRTRKIILKDIEIKVSISSDVNNEIENILIDKFIKAYNKDKISFLYKNPSKILMGLKQEDYIIIRKIHNNYILYLMIASKKPSAEKHVKQSWHSEFYIKI